MGFKTVAAVTLVFAVESARILDAQADRRGPLSARGTASIAGRIIDSDRNTPVRAAQVVAVGERGTVHAVSDDAGAYRLDGLAAGEWRITASKGGYRSWQYGQRRPFRAPPPVVLASGQRLTADIPLTRGAAIAGRILDEFGGPVAGLQVRAYRARMEGGVRRLQAVAAADLTDDTGGYRVYGLPPGDYYVAASVRVAPVGSVVQTTYAPTYYPGTGALGEAQRIRLGPAGEATATFSLLPVRRVRVSGTVLSSSGSPADAFLNLESDASEFGVPLGIGGVTRADGQFTLADVPPGTYRLTAALRGDGPDESGSVSLTVYADDVSGTTVVTGRPAALRGTIVVDAGATGRAPAPLVVTAVSPRAGGAALGSGRGTPFAIDGLAEPFLVTVEGLSEDWAVKDVTVEGVPALDTPVALLPGQQARARIVLTDRVTEVTGTIEAADTAEESTVVVFPEDSARWSARSSSIRAVRADPRGAFRVKGLPTGQRYLAVAVDYLEEGEHLDPDFLNAMRPLAAAFVLGPEDRRVVTVGLVAR